MSSRIRMSRTDKATLAAAIVAYQNKHGLTNRGLADLAGLKRIKSLAYRPGAMLIIAARLGLPIPQRPVPAERTQTEIGEAGRRGGHAVAETHGQPHYEAMGAMGGKQHDRATHWSRAGAKGGATTRERYGVDFYREIGRRGLESQRAARKQKEQRDASRSF